MEINLNPGFFLPASEYFRRHKDVQKRHSGSLSPLLEALVTNGVTAAGGAGGGTAGGGKVLRANQI